MNKLVTVITVAAVAALAGCKDQNYKPMASSQNEAKSVASTTTQENAATIETEEATCSCPKGTKHETPCACGASDCACVVVQPKAEKKTEAQTKPAEPEYTLYIVQRGDYLAKISKKFNITIAAIKSLNNMKSDTVRIGQKLKLPGKVEVGEQKDPTAQAKAKKAAAANADYTGATKEYVVKSGDTLGAIAYGHGINIRQLKKLNGLSSNAIKVGQKLKVPATATTTAKAEKKTAKATPKTEKKAEPAKEEPKATEEVSPAPVVEPESAPTAETSAQPAAETTPTPSSETSAPTAPDATTMTYTVQEGDDLTGVSIRFGVNAAVIRELNNLPEDAQLTPGQVIKLPADAL